MCYREGETVLLRNGRNQKANVFRPGGGCEEAGDDQDTVGLFDDADEGGCT